VESICLSTYLEFLLTFKLLLGKMYQWLLVSKLHYYNLDFSSPSCMLKEYSIWHSSLFTSHNWLPSYFFRHLDLLRTYFHTKMIAYDLLEANMAILNVRRFYASYLRSSTNFNHLSRVLCLHISCPWNLSSLRYLLH